MFVRAFYPTYLGLLATDVFGHEELQDVHPNVSDRIMEDFRQAELYAREAREEPSFSTEAIALFESAKVMYHHTLEILFAAGEKDYDAAEVYLLSERELMRDLFFRNNEELALMTQFHFSREFYDEAAWRCHNLCRMGEAETFRRHKHLFYNLSGIRAAGTCLTGADRYVA